MKNSINFILSIILALALNGCSADLDNSQDFDTDFNELLIKWELSYQNVCTTVEDAVKLPEPWNVDVARTFIIPDETIRSMSTCGLLDTYLTFPSYPDPNGGNFFNPAITEFNANLQENKVALALFERSDYFPVLASKYLTCIKEIKQMEKNSHDRIFEDVDDLEWLLASDMCMKVTDEKEKNQLMAMALAFEEKSKINGHILLNSYNIMIAIMLWCDYDPFIKEIGPRIREGAGGYYLIRDDGSDVIIGSDIDLILKYANEFLNE